MEVRSSRPMRTLVTQMAVPVEVCPPNEIARVDIHDGQERNELQSKAGYIDARPLTAGSTKTSCDARPDHTLGHVWTTPAGQGFFWLSACGRVQVMCPACLRGAHGRWP